jgi:hypothetical protein
MKKVIKDGKVGVLISPGYGAGFSSWGAPIEAIFNPTLIELVEEKHTMEFVPNEKGGITRFRVWDDPKYKELIQKMIDFVENTWEDVYSGGVPDLQVVWIPEGSKFIIEEYDGSESLQLMDETNWITA